MKNLIQKLWLPLLKSLVTLTTLSTYAGGGGIDSGGGKFSSTSINPWFLENTPQVSYCISIDETHFGISRATAQEVVRKALDYWTDQLRDADQRGSSLTCGLGDNCFPKIGTQQFVEERCTVKTLLQFKLGMLNKSDKEKIEDPKSLVGLAYRTSYDDVNLRGKGFIYIAPESGPLKMESETAMNNPWSTDGSIRLFAVLLHELGHVFGFTHGSIPKLMDEGFAEETIHKGAAPYSAQSIQTHFNSSRRLFKYDHATYSPTGDSSQTIGYETWHLFSNFWGIDTSRWNQHVVSYRVGPNGSFELIAYPQNFSPNNKVEVLGTATLAGGGSDFHRKKNGLFTLFLPKTQTVYPVRGYANPYSIGYILQNVHLKGTYESADGKTIRPITLIARFPFGGGNVGGVFQGSYFFDAFMGF